MMVLMGRKLYLKMRLVVRVMLLLAVMAVMLLLTVMVRVIYFINLTTNRAIVVVFSDALRY